ncbi:MAG: hypothetical protein IKN98_04420 [Bacteroidales bacterium]|nr:hypothetical protein [Bacteroidales bacterium]
MRNATSDNIEISLNKEEYPMIRTGGLNKKHHQNYVFTLIIGVILLSGCSGKSVHNDTNDSSKEINSSLNNSIETYDDITFETDRDTNQYKQCLYHLKQLVDKNACIPSSVLCDAAPRTEKEYHISYRLTECTWTKDVAGGTASLIDMNNMLWQYAMADSVGVIEAYMLFGEFVDGYVAESTFNNLIVLEEKYPSKFAQLRKERSNRWNEVFDEWKAK